LNSNCRRNSLTQKPKKLIGQAAPKPDSTGSFHLVFCPASLSGLAYCKRQILR